MNEVNVNHSLQKYKKKEKKTIKYPSNKKDDDNISN